VVDLGKHQRRGDYYPTHVLLWNSVTSLSDLTKPSFKKDSTPISVLSAPFPEPTDHHQQILVPWSDNSHAPYKSAYCYYVAGFDRTGRHLSGRHISLVLATSMIFPAHWNSGKSSAHSSCLQIVATHPLHIWCCAYKRFWFVEVVVGF